jgi:peptidoglycan/LPS O-acetylase OafA/YrhL
VSLVVASHLLWHPDFASFQPIYAKWFAPLGHLGVRVFFVISGFLITGLLLRELEATSQIALGKFYFRRVLRIFPRLLLLPAPRFGRAGVWVGQSDPLSAATYTVNYLPQASWYIGHAWSLSVEEQFYLLWPAVLVALGRRRGLGVALTVVMLCPLIRLSVWYLWPRCSSIRSATGSRLSRTRSRWAGSSPACSPGSSSEGESPCR